MNTITEKHTEKKQALIMASNLNPQPDKQTKKQYIHYIDSNGNDLGPEILEAHILALMGNVLS
jgi:hypothetical protein